VSPDDDKRSDLMLKVLRKVKTYMKRILLQI
jgi:hypothetical protein